MGKFYEMFEMDAHTGAEVLGLIYMKACAQLTWASDGVDGQGASAKLCHRELTAIICRGSSRIAASQRQTTTGMLSGLPGQDCEWW